MCLNMSWIAQLNRIFSKAWKKDKCLFEQIVTGIEQFSVSVYRYLPLPAITICHDYSL